MEALKELLGLDWIAWILGAFVIMAGITSGANIIGKFSEIIGKPVKWVRKKDEDHKLLMDTIQDLKKLREQHNKDVQNTENQEKKIESDLDKFVSEIRDVLKETQGHINQFAENRIHDRAQSLEIQRQLTDSIQTIAENGQRREKQINSLMIGTMELLGDKIDEKFTRYVELNGIPENEVTEFDSLYNAYALTGGNSTRKHKYEYVKNNLKVIPVEINLLTGSSRK